MGLESRKWSWYVDNVGWMNGNWKDLLLQKEAGVVDDETTVQWEGFNNHIKFCEIYRLYFYLINGKVYFSDSEEDLKSAFEESGFASETMIWGMDLPNKGIPFEKLKISDFIFHPDIKSFMSQRNSEFITVLCGQNNSGKSLFLKMLRLQLGRKASLLSCNRFYHIDTLSYSTSSKFQSQQNYDNWERNVYVSKQNDESCNVNFANIVQEMKDDEREDFFETCKSIIGLDIELKQVDEENKLSPYRISIEGRSLSLASTGIRLFLLIMASLYDRSISYLLIDEPELGLSPPLQEKLSNLFSDKNYFSKTFPHLKQIIIASHSNLFLSKIVTNNFSVKRENEEIFLTKCESFADFHRLQFNLLGNNLESMHFPSAILIVEGKTDFSYIDAVIRLKLPNNRITVIESCGNVKTKVHDLKKLFHPFEKSPMRSRIFVVNDEITQRGLRNELERQGLLPENIVFWSKNGIEYVYPKSIMMEIFSCSEAQLETMTITGDEISVGQMVQRKNDLSNQVIGKFNGQVDLPPEFNEFLFNKVVDAIS